MHEPLTALGAESELRAWVEEYAADRAAIGRRYPCRWSSRTMDRKQALAELWLERVRSVDFERLGAQGRVDALLLENHLEGSLASIAADRRLAAEAESLLGIVEDACALELARKDRRWIGGRDAAEALHRMADRLQQVAHSLSSGTPSDLPMLAGAADVLQDLRRSLDDWHAFYDGYDPEFTWWVAEPWKRLVGAWEGLTETLKRAIGDSGDHPPIVGRRVGREGLVEGLAREWISETPERLLEIGEAEMDWCERRLREASRELGCGDDWKAAIEKVKDSAVAPGLQPQMVAELAEEAERYLLENDLMDVPDLAREVWQMAMMSAEQQKVAPFFYGGETIVVSYPTNAMDHGLKLMSLRGNNPHFSRATVHHELIPGHHLQGFHQERFHPHRKVFRTPFWIEGWTLYWELYLWDRGFPRGPEDRIGMLFWRMHRAARVVFSLKFHMGAMEAAECVDFLVERVGHERSNAEGEVRRSFRGGYEPLYQAAYLIGGKQVYALQRELLGAGWPAKRFHAEFLRTNQMPIELAAALLRGEPIPRPFRVEDPLLSRS
ncbi:MAG: DUF885 domain-containing protein [Fimbriimonadales bacterium]|nr:DUF885 domain-containing protein [Fimbriimonadales bacterium]